ncbi:hypothetical protein [Sulfobacillus harzensis]|uniref:Uncharacterized protein n=1 Tax=Sulfobacillus harzensis TaxID=2729629 RepID=A0A7Y0Q1G2_9FIRM|nr:hypothetical protein [Sulfobacillus harzensis]NMP21305.1 hypothetical protein [Sulfobacillus harzensis]
MTDKDIVIISVDRSDPEVVLVNTTVDFLHCPIRFSKALLRSLGYTVYRPQKLKPIVHAAVWRHIARHGEKKLLGGFSVDDGDVEGLPPNPVARG